MNKQLLVFIKDGGTFDAHCGEISYYYPITMNKSNHELNIDNSIRIECANWAKPHEQQTVLNKCTNYLINDGKNYGTMCNEQIHWYDSIESNKILIALKNMAYSIAFDLRC